MHDIALRFRCPANPLHCCVDSPAEITQAEMMVEDRAGQALYPLFEVVYMDEVSFYFPPSRTTEASSVATFAEEGAAPLIILIHAKGESPYPLVTVAGVDRTVEEHVRQALGDLFGILEGELFIDN
jgi:hypothetical protein